MSELYSRRAGGSNGRADCDGGLGIDCRQESSGDDATLHGFVYT
jgi:hypothetical protein